MGLAGQTSVDSAHNICVFRTAHAIRKYFNNENFAFIMSQLVTLLQLQCEIERVCMCAYAHGLAYQDRVDSASVR